MSNLKTTYYLQKRLVKLFFSEKWYNKIKLALIILEFKLNRPYEMSPLLKDMLTFDSIIFDIGANMGHYACRLSNIVNADSGHVFCFEPVKANFMALSEMKRTLKLNNVTVNKLAISNVIENASINIPVYKNGLVVGTQASLFKENDITYKTENIKLTTIDDFCKKNKINRLDFIKCDTEGNEANVLEGGRQTITKHLPILSFEMLYTDKELDWLIKLGYELFYYDKQINKLINIGNYQTGNLIMINKKQLSSLKNIIEYAV